MKILLINFQNQIQNLLKVYKMLLLGDIGNTETKICLINSNNKIIITNDLTFSFIEFQLLNNAIGVMIVVNKTKYIDKPSNPR